MRWRAIRAPMNSQDARALLYFSVPMNRKSQARKRTKRKNTGPQMVAHAALPTRYGRFTIYGFKGRGPQGEAGGAGAGGLDGEKATFGDRHSHGLAGRGLPFLRCELCAGDDALAGRSHADEPAS